jgi:predicted pyridoxine 5'-phosphate oxidase superfamily flavin-nucleotide-binding protein
MGRPASDIAFSDSVKAAQQRLGSRAHYERMEEKGGWADAITPELAQFIAGVRSFYIGTASAGGQPYIQHRGGPAGFLKVLDEKTLGLADYLGNRQYITLGNLAENPRAFIFLMDYARRVRIKLWGTARVVEGDETLMARLADKAGGAPERAILFHVEAWDRNCPQHIPQLFPAEDVQTAIEQREARIAELEAEVVRLRGLSQQS